MSSLKEQRDKIFQEKLQELGDMGTKERTLEDAPFYDKPVTSLALPPKENKEEITSESTSTISFSQLLLSGKLQNGTFSLSATPINRRCGFLFRKVSPSFRQSFIGCPLKQENGRHEMWPNVYFKPLRGLEYG